GRGAALEGFTAQQASRFTGCTPRQLRYWDQIGLVRPTVQQTGGRPGVPRMYAFRDLVALKVVKSLLDRGMSLQRVRRAWDYLNREVGLDDHLAGVRLETDGKSIFRVVRREGEVLDALRKGQMAFFVAIVQVALQRHALLQADLVFAQRLRGTPPPADIRGPLREDSIRGQNARPWVRGSGHRYPPGYQFADWDGEGDDEEQAEEPEQDHRTW